MSNKMKNIFIILFLFFVVLCLEAFEPEENDFENNYQFRMYESWLDKGGFKPNFPGEFSVRKVVKHYHTGQQEIVTEFDWENWKIFRQREIIPAATQFKTAFPEIADKLESLIYRLNCADSTFFFDYLNHSGIEIIFPQLQSSSPSRLLWEKFSSLRVEIDSLHFGRYESSLLLNLRIADSEIEFQMLIPTRENDLARLRQYEKSVKKPYLESSKARASYQEGDATFQPVDLVAYIKQNMHISQVRELLNNKIPCVEDFLKAEFPGYEFDCVDSLFYLNGSLFQETIPSAIFIQSNHTKDGVTLYALSDFQLSGNNIKLPSGELIPTSGLNKEDMDILGTRLPHLIYEHRALGSRLLNFLLFHDDVPTTLVLNGEKREIYDLPSYANLLLILSSFWENHKVYFGMDKVTRIDGYIEMKGTLLVTRPDAKEHDLAEIRFHLNKEYKIDLIMVVIHQNIES